MQQRVDLIDRADAPILARDFFPEDGEASPILRALAQVPELVPETMRFVGRVLSAGAINLRTKELIILRVSAEARCRYCVGAHRVAACDAGVTATESAALLGLVPLEDTFSASDLAILRLADAVAAGGDVAVELTSAVRARLDHHGLVEVVMVAATTLMLNRFCTTLALPLTVQTRARLEPLDADGLVS